jgi:hypothetical protein
MAAELAHFSSNKESKKEGIEKSKGVNFLEIIRSLAITFVKKSSISGTRRLSRA